MYYLAKIAQAAGLSIILWDFLRHFPALMNFKIWGIGIIIFLFGWLIQYFLLKPKI